MLDLISVVNLINKYTINNGNVYLKDSNHQIIDEDIIKQVNTAYLIYNDARDSYKKELMRTKKVDKNLKDYLKLTLENFLVNNRINSHDIDELKNLRRL